MSGRSRAKTAGTVQGQPLATLLGGTGKVGIIDATMVQRPVQTGVLSIQWAYDILTGAAMPSCTNIDTGVTVVTKDNLTTYTKWSADRRLRVWVARAGGGTLSRLVPSRN